MNQNEKVLSHKHRRHEWGYDPSSPHYGLNFTGQYLAIGSPLNAIILEFFGHANDSSPAPCNCKLAPSFYKRPPWWAYILIPTALKWWGHLINWEASRARASIKRHLRYSGTRRNSKHKAENEFKGKLHSNMQLHPILLGYERVGGVGGRL